MNNPLKKVTIMQKLFAVYHNDQVVTIEMSLRKAEREINKLVARGMSVDTLSIYEIVE
jgi:hypothetical protein